ncbi:PRD domain-containing protein [Bacillus sp. SL00103]
MEIPEAEVGYMTIHLRSAKPRTFGAEYRIDEIELDIAIRTKKLIDFISNKTGYHLNENDSLYEGLVSHLEPPMNRLKEKMRIYNPLTQQTKKTTFCCLWRLKKESSVSFRDCISEDEIAFIVLHFWLSAWNQKRRNEHSCIGRAQAESVRPKCSLLV